MADPRFYLATLAIFAIMFFLQPSLLAMRSGIQHRLRSNDILPSPSFRLFGVRRVLVSGSALALSLLAPTLFGMSVLVPLIILGGLVAITGVDWFKIDEIAKRRADASD
jgi:hypothetical protein